MPSTTRALRQATLWIEETSCVCRCFWPRTRQRNCAGFQRYDAPRSARTIGSRTAGETAERTIRHSAAATLLAEGEMLAPRPCSVRARCMILADVSAMHTFR